MKYGRGKWVYGAFAMVARDAAQRFAFNTGNPTGGRGSWRPLILRWRLRRNRLAKPESGRVAAQAPSLWFPQSHFHYATYLGDRMPHNRASGSPSTSRVTATRIVQDHQWTNVRPAELPRKTFPAYSPLRRFYSRESARPGIDAGFTTTPGSTRPPGGRSGASPAARPPRALLGKTPRVACARARREEGAQPFHTHSRIWRHWLQVFRMRRPTLDDRIPHRSPERKALGVRFDSPEELVWRRAKRPPAEVVDIDRHQAASDSYRPAVRSFQSQQVANLSPVSERATAAQITTLDSGFLDRLTDTVIRRVEQRARIERQRRGL